MKKSKVYGGGKDNDNIGGIEMLKTPFKKSRQFLEKKDQITKEIDKLPNKEDRYLLYSLFDKGSEENWKLLKKKHKDIAEKIYFYNIQIDYLFYPRKDIEIESYLFDKEFDDY